MLSAEWKGRDPPGVEEVTGFRLGSRRGQPEILAVDSLQEIAADRNNSTSSCRPSAIDKTRSGDRRRAERDPRKVAARYNISFNRFDPYR